MSAFKDPFDPDLTLGACTCGEHRSQAEHEAARVGDTAEALNRRVIQSALMRALFPQDAVRRRFLHAVGASTALAAVSSMVPFGALEAMAQGWVHPDHLR
jgi:nitrate/nitrite transport system substrate-binding protein